MMTHVGFHVVFPLVEIGRVWRARNAFACQVAVIFHAGHRIRAL